MRRLQQLTKAHRRRLLLTAQAALLLIAVSVAILVSRAGDWQPVELLVALLIIALAGEFGAIRTGNVHIGPAFVATVLAMALLGPAPAALLAVLAMLGPSIREKLSPELIFNNVVAMTTFPVVGALLIQAIGDPHTGNDTNLATFLVVFGVSIAMNLLNFALIVGYDCARDATSFRAEFSRLYVPVLPWEFATAFLAAGTAYLYPRIGLVAVIMLALLLLSQRFLLKAVVNVERQRDELRAQMDEMLALHDGVIRVMVETLSMRDQMTARHSAAVARFARATAQAMGLPEREQRLVHTAGLLHDIGKFAFPDHTLKSTTLSDADWALIRSHPQRGADIVRRVRGYEEVADIILSHHEHVDGSGYPRGQTQDEIPMLARIIAVVDTFDVMTARDSYRTPVSVEEAVVELRRVSATQLDEGVVRVFLGMLEGGGVGFGHADDADLQVELSAGRRERFKADREGVVGPPKIGP